MPRKKTVNVDDITLDNKNFNAGSDKGKIMLEKSIRKFGAGRSILVDKNLRAISGNKTLEGFKASGGQKVMIVEADRDTLVAVKRIDIDLDSKEGREMALADNQTQSINYVPDEEMIEMVAEELNIDTGEWGIDAGEPGAKKKLKEEDIRPFIQTHILLSFPPEKILELEPHLEAIRKIAGVEYEQGSN